MNYQRSDEIKDLAAALCKVQATLKNAVKGAENPHFRSTYSDLADCWDTCRKPLTDNGFSIVQTPFFRDGLVGADTMLLHNSGQYIQCTFSVPIDRANAQGVGSGLTYVRRYSLCSIVGIASEDDDANAVSQKTSQQQTTQQPKNKSAPVKQAGPFVPPAANEIYTGSDVHKKILGEICTRKGISSKGVMLAIHEQSLNRPFSDLVDTINMYVEKRKEQANDERNTEDTSKT